MCGTSIAQIEKTYYHLNDAIRLTNAVADRKRKIDGTIMPIWDSIIERQQKEIVMQNIYDLQDT